jgi:hypothetical protein
VYWIKQPIPPPGQPRAEDLVTRQRMFTQSRGGLSSSEKNPLLRPDLSKKR